MDGDRNSLKVSISGSQQQRHVGFEVMEDGELYIYHLAFHCMFKREKASDYPSDYYPVELPNFTPHEKLHISSYLKAILQRNGSDVPYGINFVPGLVIDKDGDVVEGLPAGSGLTCATFVIEVFLNQAFEIMDIDSWKLRDGDEVWQKSILEMLSRYSSAEHVSAMQQSVGRSSRYRPEEVAGCARKFDDEPIQFDGGVILGSEIVREMTDAGVMNI